MEVAPNGCHARTACSLLIQISAVDPSRLLHASQSVVDLQCRARCNASRRMTVSAVQLRNISWRGSKRRYLLKKCASVFSEDCSEGGGKEKDANGSLNRLHRSAASSEQMEKPLKREGGGQRP